MFLEFRTIKKKLHNNNIYFCAHLECISLSIFYAKKKNRTEVEERSESQVLCLRYFVYNDYGYRHN